MKKLITILIFLVSCSVFGQVVVYSGSVTDANYVKKDATNILTGSNTFNGTTSINGTTTLPTITGNVHITGNLTVDGSTFSTMAYAQYSDTTTQAMVSTRATAVTFNKTDLTPLRITKTNDSLFYPTNPGIYKILVSAIVDLSAGDKKHTNIFLNVNGTTVPYSGTVTELPTADIEMVVCVEFIVSITAGQYFKIMKWADSTSARLLFTAKTATCPASPSVIMTICKISQ
jgi:hypothetical protein